MSYVGASLKEVFDEERKKFNQAKLYMALGLIQPQPCRLFVCNSAEHPNEGVSLTEEISIRAAISTVPAYVNYMVVKESRSDNLLTLHICDISREELRELMLGRS